MTALTTKPSGSAPPETDDVAPEGRLARDFRRAMVDPSADRQSIDVITTHDRVATFGPVVTTMRLATTAVSLLLVSNDLLGGEIVNIVCTIIVLSYSMIRTFRPIRYDNELRSLLRVVGELAIHVGVVVLTGGWDSPFVFSLITAACIAGFARGFGFAMRIGAATAFAVSAPVFIRGSVTEEALKQCGTWTAFLIMISIIAAWGRRISGEADRERDLAFDRVSRLADANTLLYSLHRIAQTLPASLDMNDVLDSTVLRLRGLIDFDTLVVLLFDDTDAHWQVVRREGCTIQTRLGATDLPVGLREAIATDGIVSVGSLNAQDGFGFDDRSGSALYAPLSARGAIIGLIALEHRDRHRFDQRSIDLVEGLVPPLSLALDNAKWFARLRTVGADEERTRIARDLHDRIGQSLAYLAFETDRIVSKDGNGEKVSESLGRLRDDIRGVIGEVRDTLYDLRTDVSEDQSLASILDQYATRVGDRTSLDFQIDADAERRLPILQEREMWRITQEAVTNIERHAMATRVRVTWRCDGERAAIRITDNGVGFELGRAGRLDSYGMLGMRERASSIGATLDVHSIPGQGTSITCVLDPSTTRPSGSTDPRASSRKTASTQTSTTQRNSPLSSHGGTRS